MNVKQLLVALLAGIGIKGDAENSNVVGHTNNSAVSNTNPTMVHEAIPAPIINSTANPSLPAPFVATKEFVGTNKFTQNTTELLTKEKEGKLTAKDKNKLTNLRGAIRGLATGQCSIYDMSVVLDASGSMGVGQKWSDALLAVTQVLQGLGPQLVYGTEFSNYAQALVGPGPLDSNTIAAILAAQFIGGGTEISTAFVELVGVLPQMVNDANLQKSIVMTFSDFNDNSEDVSKIIALNEQIAAQYPQAERWCIAIGQGTDSEANLALAQTLCGNNVIQFPAGDINPEEIVATLCTAPPSAVPSAAPSAFGATRAPTMAPTNATNSTAPGGDGFCKTHWWLCIPWYFAPLARTKKIVGPVDEAVVPPQQDVVDPNPIFRREAAESISHQAIQDNRIRAAGDTIENPNTQHDVFGVPLFNTGLRTHTTLDDRWGARPGNFAQSSSPPIPPRPTDPTETAPTAKAEQPKAREFYVGPLVIVVGMLLINQFRDTDKAPFPLEIDTTKAVGKMRKFLGLGPLSSKETLSATSPVTSNMTASPATSSLATPFGGIRPGGTNV